MSRGVDVLVIAPHPDDAEIGCGGSIVRWVEAGLRVGVVDVTAGEAGTLGSPAQRAEEAARATALLGLAHRENLGLPDAAVDPGGATVRALVEVIRRLRPTWLLAPNAVDPHPDHEAVARACRQSMFHAGLARFEPQAGPAFRPRVMLRYAINDCSAPTFCLDISAWFERKRAAIACYVSQLPSAPADRGHFLRGRDALSRIEVRDGFFGSQCGCDFAEPLWTDQPIAIDRLVPLLGVRS